MLFLDLTATNSSELCESNTQLGNVLFQLAAQYCICKKYNIQSNYYCLYEFIKKIENFGLKNYDTTIFRNINCNDDKKDTIDLVIKEKKWCNTYDNNLVQKIIENKNSNILIQNSYLQSIKYFHEYENIVQNLFNPDKTSLKQIYLKYPQLKENNTINISIHIRLHWGDIKYNCNYYKDAIEFFIKKYKNTSNKINFFVFSDNIPESKKILDNLDYNFIYCEDNLNYIDLWIMSLCSDNIICHSTFGWWGAYLNKNENKSVVYPSDVLSTFFNKIMGKTNIEEIKNNFFPKEWISIQSNSMSY